MIYFNAFIFAGLICLIGEIIYSFTKLTTGHITTFFVIIGAILGGIGIYDYLIEWCGGGATCLIMNFGNLLVKGGLEGAKKDGIIGIFSSLLLNTSTTLSFVIFISIFASLLPNIRNKKWYIKN